LMSTIAAERLGFLRTPAMARRLDTLLTTLEALERHEGHMLNWYDTASLAPLLPRYVSTVDSGNLAAALLAAAGSLRRIAASPGGDAERSCLAIGAALGVLREALAELAPAPEDARVGDRLDPLGPRVEHLDAQLEAMQAVLAGETPCERKI